MTRSRCTIGAAAVVALGLCSLAWSLPGFLRRVRPVEQPIAFSHATHVTGEEMECSDCHSAEETVGGGWPTIKSCHECHTEPEGEHPDEPKVREYYKARQQVPWIQVSKNSGHVYFSHRRHVQLAELGCEDCHGKVEEWEEPPRLPDPYLLSMDACIECHEERGSSIECAVCH